MRGTYNVNEGRLTYLGVFLILRKAWNGALPWLVYIFMWIRTVRARERFELKISMITVFIDNEF